MLKSIIGYDKCEAKKTKEVVMYNYEEEYLDSLSSLDSVDLQKIQEEKEEQEQFICDCFPEYAYASGMRRL